MFKMFIIVFSAVVLGGLTILLGYNAYLNMQISSAIEQVEQKKQNEAQKAREKKQKAQVMMTEFNVKQCVHHSKKDHKETFELVSVDHRTSMLVALTFHSQGYKYHNRCYFNEGSYELRSIETYSKTKL